jgi:hypothetical protein
MKIKDKVVLTKDIPFDGGVLKAATVGEVCNIIVIKGEEIVLFNPVGTTEIYAVSISSLKQQ